jgi:hypothetical protein
MVLSIDNMPPPGLVDRIHTEGFDDARSVELG